MFTSRDDLKKHIQTSPVAPLNSKLLQMEKEISEQRLQIATSLFNLKQQELKEKLQPCVCRGFCSINHIKYNWTKSVSENLFSRYKSHYSCNQCSENFQNLHQLKAHMGTYYSNSRETENGGNRFKYALRQGGLSRI